MVMIIFTNKIPPWSFSIAIKDWILGQTHSIGHEYDLCTSSEHFSDKLLGTIQS